MALHWPAGSGGRSKCHSGAEEAVDLLEAAIREWPGVAHVESTRNHLQTRATACYADPYDLAQLGRYKPDALDGQPAQPDPGHGQSQRRQQPFQPGR